jgi:hypothetical protein
MCGNEMHSRNGLQECDAVSGTRKWNIVILLFFSQDLNERLP